MCFCVAINSKLRIISNLHGISIRRSILNYQRINLHENYSRTINSNISTYRRQQSTYATSSDSALMRINTRNNPRASSKISAYCFNKRDPIKPNPCIHNLEFMQISLENMKILTYSHVYQPPELDIAKAMTRPNVKYT